MSRNHKATQSKGPATPAKIVPYIDGWVKQTSDLWFAAQGDSTEEISASAAAGHPTQPFDHGPREFCPAIARSFDLELYIPDRKIELGRRGPYCQLGSSERKQCHKLCLPSFLYSPPELAICTVAHNANHPTLIWRWSIKTEKVQGQEDQPADWHSSYSIELMACWYCYTTAATGCGLISHPLIPAGSSFEPLKGQSAAGAAVASTSDRPQNVPAPVTPKRASRVASDSTSLAGRIATPSRVPTKRGQPAAERDLEGPTKRVLRSSSVPPQESTPGRLASRARSALPQGANDPVPPIPESIPTEPVPTIPPALRAGRQYLTEMRSRQQQPGLAEPLSHNALASDGGQTLNPADSLQAAIAQSRALQLNMQLPPPPPIPSSPVPSLRPPFEPVTPGRARMRQMLSGTRPSAIEEVRSRIDRAITDSAMKAEQHLANLRAGETDLRELVNSLFTWCEAVEVAGKSDRQAIELIKAEKDQAVSSMQAMDNRVASLARELARKTEELGEVKGQAVFLQDKYEGAVREQNVIEQRMAKAIEQRDGAVLDAARCRQQAKDADENRRRAEAALEDACTECDEARDRLLQSETTVSDLRQTVLYLSATSDSLAGDRNDPRKANTALQPTSDINSSVHHKEDSGEGVEQGRRSGDEASLPADYGVPQNTLSPLLDSIRLHPETLDDELLDLDPLLSLGHGDVGHSFM